MSLTEHIVGRVSGKELLIFLGIIYTLWRLYVNIDKTVRLRRLPGTRATVIPGKLPYGLDFVKLQISATLKHKNLEMWHSLLDDKPAYTAEFKAVGRRIIFTADPENIKAILATQFHDYGKGEPFHKEWKDFLGDSIFTTDGSQWHASRQLLRPQFSRERISDLDCFESHLETLFRAIANGSALEGEDQEVDVEAGNGKKIEVSDLFFRYTLDVTTDFLLGKDVKSLTTPRQDFADSFNEVQHIQNIMTRAGPLRHLIPRRAFLACLRVVNQLCNTYIDRALRLSPEELGRKTRLDHSYTFLHELASFTRDRRVIRDQLVAILLAGRDTTAATLSWTIYELGRHPDCVARLRAEILAQVGPERRPTYADLKSMRYLQNVMRETLRLYPAVPYNVRLALKDTTLPRGGGPDGRQPVAVLKDTPIGYSPLLMQRRADLYPPASPAFAPVEVYSPERWDKWYPEPWQYIPFNGGPRTCVGQQFALTEMGYVLTRLCQRFERVESFMEEVDGGKPTMKAEIVIQPGDGVKVAFWEGKKG